LSRTPWFLPSFHIHGDAGGGFPDKEPSPTAGLMALGASLYWALIQLIGSRYEFVKRNTDVAFWSGRYVAKA
jgi:hypothetical protein